MRSALIGVLAALALTAPVHASAEGVSVLPAAPAEPRAVTVAAMGDGTTDDSEALQRALDQAVDATHHGLVFLPSGRYRITRTLVVPQGVRLYGVGPTRPVILLGADTPGFQQGVSTMIVFAGGDQYQVGEVPVPVPTIVPRDKVVRDANSGTFYSSMSNVDIEIGPATRRRRGCASAWRSMPSSAIWSSASAPAFAGVYQAGNMMQDVDFVGGRYGIVTEKTSPAWQFTLLDSRFSGQRDAAIREHEVDLTLVNVAIADTPVGIEIDRGYSDFAVGQGRSVRTRQPRRGVDLEREQRVHPGGVSRTRSRPTPRFSRGSATADGRSTAKATPTR
jgi:hypothetical protein